jgi:hypothetical protein
MKKGIGHEKLAEEGRWVVRPGESSECWWKKRDHKTETVGREEEEMGLHKAVKE